MPHPRFYEFNDDVNVRKNIKILIQILKKTENVYIDTNDDYRNSLIHSQSVIVDRSGVMVEAGSLGVPVLYMYNPDYKEPLSDAIEALILIINVKIIKTWNYFCICVKKEKIH